MQNIDYRLNATNRGESSEPTGRAQMPRRNQSQQSKTMAFSSRTCVALAVGSAVGILGALYCLANSQSNIPQSPLSERLNTPTCFNAGQFTSSTGTSASNENDIYCTYPDQILPGQMTELINHGIISVIEQAGDIIYQGAKNTFECINQGLAWRQYIDESVCVRMDSVTCSSLGGHISRGGSVCLPAIDPENPASSALCTRDLVSLCKWRSQ